MRNLKQIMASCTLATLMLLSNASHALLGEEFLKLNTDEKNGYMIGALEMLAYIQFDNGNDQRGQCMFDWFEKDDTYRTIWDYAEKYPDKSVQGMMLILVRRACPDDAN